MKLNSQEKPYQKVLRIENILSSGDHFSVDELTHLMGIDSRSVFRYLERLTKTGCEVSNQTRNGRVKEYWITQAKPEVPQDLIDKLQKMDQTMTSGGIRKYHKTILQAISQLSPQTEFTGATKVSPSVKFSTGRSDIEPNFHLDHGPLAEYHNPDSLKDRMMDQIMTAIQNQSRIRITYNKVDKGNKKEPFMLLFEPYFLSLRVGKLYLVGCHQDQKKKPLVSIVFRRIRMITDTGIKFDRDPKANLADYYKHCFGQWIPREDAKKLDILLKVDQSWLLELFNESNFHPEASIETTGQGGTVRLCLYDTPDLESWLFGLHPHAQVIEPKALRLRLKNRASEALRMLA
jgi:predicted DNA-binding transcriptional regulator YafY